MKKILLLLTLTVILFSSCEEENTIPGELIGKWEWTSSCGGIAGVTETPESTGDRIVIEFTSNSLYRSYKNDTFVTEIEYKIIVAESIYDHQSTKMIEFSTGQFRKSFSVTNEELILKDEVYDGFVSSYILIE